ncbi:hypothetical protein ACFL14_00210 [Patescibacteria group bacterium]
MYKKIFAHTFSGLVTTVLLPSIVLAGACDPNTGNAYERLMNTIRNSDSFVLNQDLLCMLGAVVQLLLLFAWVAALIWVVISGTQYVTSVGDPEKMAGAKQSLLSAIIGLIIALSAYAIIRFIVDVFA